MGVPESHCTIFYNYGQDAYLPLDAALSKPCNPYQVNLHDYKIELVTGLSEA